MLNVVQNQSAECATCAARSQSIFADLRTEDIIALNNAKRCGSYPKGSTIFSAGAYPTGLYCVFQGRVKVYCDGPEHEQIVRFAREGDILGYRALLGGSALANSAVAVEDSHVCHIPRDIIFALVERKPDLSRQILTLMAHDLRSAEQRLMEIVQKPARERLAEALLILKEKCGTQPDQQTLDIALSRADLANYSGMAMESVSRLLSQFKDEGILALTGRKIAIVDHGALLKAANLED